MSKKKLFLIAFITAFTLTMALCMIQREPLVFYPIDYGLGGFLWFGLLIAFLCFGLVYINLPFLKFIKKSFPAVNEKSFYVIGTLIILQIVTLVTGLMESSLANRGRESNIFYYYEGVSNSLIYILTGNFTAVLIATIYALDQIRIKQESSIKFDFDSKGEIIK